VSFATGTLIRLSCLPRSEGFPIGHEPSDHPAHPSKIQVFHSTAPTCFWSWGYEAVFNRLKLVYRDQIDVRVQISCVYDNFEEYLKHYELTFDGMKEWTEEAIGIIGVPLHTHLRREQFPPSQLPASMAAMAAKRQGEAQGARFFRALLRRASVEGHDVTKESAQLEAAKEAGLDLERFRDDLADHDGLVADYQNQGDEFYHMPLGFYNVILTDGENRTVILDYAFDPGIVEETIDFLSRGRLTKRTPKDILGYLRDHGPTPVREIARVFGLTPDEASAKLAAFEKEGRTRVTNLAGGHHWSAP